ncbi:MAG: hypothetical protein IPL93_05815 [Actinomycetales bacterium]|nr:hypothetical protein [Actinomycetales bacterium]
MLVVGLAPQPTEPTAPGGCSRDRSGDWLYAALHRAGYARCRRGVAAGDGQALTGMRIVATVPVRSAGKPALTREKATCAPWLDRDLTLAEPSLRSILALGGIG